MDFAESLAVARRSGEIVPPPPRLSLAAGYAVAAALYSRLGTPAGWKVGATSAAAQAFLGVAEPIRGRLFTEAIWLPGDVTLPGERAVEVEPEVVLRVGADGEPDAAWLGIEVNRPSYADPFAHGVGAIVADNAASVGVLIGQSLPLTSLDAPAAIVAAIQADEVEVARGRADTVLGDPRAAYRWLASQVELIPGELVATGAMARSAIVGRGTTLVLDGGAWGSVRFALK